MGGIRFEADGTVTIITGTLDYGQGHWTPFAQVLHPQLGMPFESIRLVQGDSDLLIAGGGTGGSKSLMASGAAIVEAATTVIEKGRTSPRRTCWKPRSADIEFAAGRFTIAGTDRSIGIMELARALRTANNPPPDLPTSLDVRHVFGEAPQAYPNGCHVCEVEVEPETGHHRGGALHVGQRLRRHRQPADGRGPGAWRHRPGHRPGADGARRLLRGRPAAVRQLPGLLPAARRRRAGSSASSATPRPAPPTRWAPRAAARPAAPGRCRR